MLRIRSVAGTPMLVIGGRGYWYLRQIVGVILMIPVVIAGYFLFLASWDGWWKNLDFGGLILRMVICAVGVYAIGLIANPKKQRRKQ